MKLINEIQIIEFKTENKKEVLNFLKLNNNYLKDYVSSTYELDKINELDLYYDLRPNMEKGINNTYLLRTKNKILLGIIQFYDYFSDNQSIKIGYILDANYQKKGIISNCLKKLINIYFNNLNINKITALIVSNNFSSEKFIQKLNFKLEGILREEIIIFNKKKFDLKIYSLLKREY